MVVEKNHVDLYRKVCEANDDGTIDIGTGEQTRSFLYIDECVDGITTLV